MATQPGKSKYRTPLSLCLFNRHAPDRHAAVWDGTHYVSRCLHCGKRVRRKARNEWRADWLWEERAEKQKPRRLAS